jgi:hypothetical protein
LLKTAGYWFGTILLYIIDYIYRCCSKQLVIGLALFCCRYPWCVILTIGREAFSGIFLSFQKYIYQKMKTEARGGEGSYSLGNGRKCGHSRVVGAKKSHNIEHSPKIYRTIKFLSTGRGNSIAMQ